MKYRVSTSTQEYTENTTIRPDGKFGGWLAVNTGTANATVDGYTLAPGEGLDYRMLRPNTIWNSTIAIVLTTGAKIRLTRLTYTEVK